MCSLVCLFAIEHQQQSTSFISNPELSIRTLMSDSGELRHLPHTVYQYSHTRFYLTHFYVLAMYLSHIKMLDQH